MEKRKREEKCLLFKIPNSKILVVVMVKMLGSSSESIDSNDSV
jgi:hypothetical protein